MLSMDARVFNGTLFPYQHEAVNLMVSRQSALVAYAMGLGKTCITIAACETLMNKGIIDQPVLVVALSSLKYQWKKEIEKFSDSTALVIDGTPKQRSDQYLLAANWFEEGIDYIVVNYETVVNDWEQFKKMKFSAIVCDEATAIKSFRSKRSKYIKTLAKRAKVRFALTGTPIENGRPEEIFSIMQFVDKSVLGDFQTFDSNFIVRNYFGGVQRYKNLKSLHSILSKAMTRKSQNDPDVAPFLPDLVHLDPMYLPLSRTAASLYNQIADDLLEELLSVKDILGTGFSLSSHYGMEAKMANEADAYMGAIMAKVVALRMVCDHPTLVLNTNNGYLNETLDDKRKDALLKASSPKLDFTVSYVSDHLDTDPAAKVVIFTTYLGMAPLLKDALEAKGIESRVYLGTMNAKEKEEAKVEFQTKPEVQVLISSDAGGYGVDLPQANLLVNYDLPWMSGKADQRNARIRRASSTWPSVIVQDVLCTGTIERRQYDMLNQKSAVASAIVDGKGINSKGGVDLTVGSLIDFLTNTRP